MRPFHSLSELRVLTTWIHRKTGVTKAVSQRDADGFEDLDNFFHSSSPARSVATTAASRSTVKKRRETQLFSRESPDYAEEYQEEDDSDMMVDDGSFRSLPAAQPRADTTWKRYIALADDLSAPTPILRPRSILPPTFDQRFRRALRLPQRPPSLLSGRQRLSQVEPQKAVGPLGWRRRR